MSLFYVGKSRLRSIWMSISHKFSRNAARGAGIHIHLRVVWRNPCPEHGYTHSDDKAKDPNHACKGGFVGITDKWDDISVTALAGLILNNILNTAQSVKDTTNTARALSANSAASALTIIAGSGTTTPAFTDYSLTTAISGSSGTVSGTANAISGTSFTVTGTLTNSSGGDLTYAEIGITVTVATYVFLLTHDLTNGSTGYVISNGGTGATTITFSFS